MSSSIFNRKGSHAGRGFRYQDAVGVWLALAAWDHQIPYGEVVPEGLDDFELKGDGLAFVQAKSRRDGLGPFSSASAIGFIEALWQRHEAAPVKPDELILVLERDVASWASAGNALLGRALTAADLAGSRLTGHPKCAALMAKTRLVVQDAPLEQSVSRLSNSLGCPPLTAEVYYGELLRRIGRLSDDNGLVTTGFAGLALSDTLDALVASDGIQRFDLGLAGRPAVEIEALKSALATLEEGLARVRPLVEAQAPEGFAGFSQFVDDVREKRVALSVDIAALQKGVMSKTITDLGVLNTTALACDLLAAIGTGPSPNADETIGDL
ncbi:MAG: hypothetical protein KXJ53_15395 [Phenylobacterium sp.]|nr:hypothetical protein [Phenylobacterium sp.]